MANLSREISGRSEENELRTRAFACEPAQIESLTMQPPGGPVTEVPSARGSSATMVSFGEVALEFETKYAES